MPTINLQELNWLAILVAAFAAFMLGGVWYGPLFGKRWTAAQGWSEGRVAEIKAKLSPAKFFGGMIVTYLVLAFAMGLIATAAGVQSVTSGVCLGGIIWIISASVSLTHHLASDKANAAYAIDSSFEFIYFLMIGAIIGGWR